MDLERIDFISAYCDRWCERCAFTSRCSAYAITIAAAMCDGDFEAAIELAVGTPAGDDSGDSDANDPSAVVAQLVNLEPTEAELREVERDLEARDERVDESPLSTATAVTMMLSHRWLGEHRERLLKDAGPQLVDALEVAACDCFLIPAKLHRALGGRDTWQHDRAADDDAVQNDWNGSAKVALISIERSASAWELIAQATGDTDAVVVAGQLRQLRREVEEAFPDASKFMRPGFDGAG